MSTWPPLRAVPWLRVGRLAFVRGAGPRLPRFLLAFFLIRLPAALAMNAPHGGVRPWPGRLRTASRRAALRYGSPLRRQVVAIRIIGNYGTPGASGDQLTEPVRSA